MYTICYFEGNYSSNGTCIYHFKLKYISIRGRCLLYADVTSLGSRCRPVSYVAPNSLQQADFNTGYLVLVNINAHIFANDNFIIKCGPISVHSIVGNVTQLGL